jgi:hypothetical protein
LQTQSGKKDDVNKILKDMKGRKIAEESSCPWSSPVLFVMKKNGDLRSCADYRRLNAVTRKGWFPVTKTEDTLHMIAEAKRFSNLDLKSRYGKNDLQPSNRKKTAFSIGLGLWQFTFIPFGLCSAPATFNLMIEFVLRRITYEACLVYLDDAIVVILMLQEQTNDQKVFQRF